MSSTTVAPPKVSWLKRVGHFLGQILGFVATEAKPIADTAAAVAGVMFPVFAPEIGAADALVTKIAQEAIKVEAVAAVAGNASGTGAQKLETVLMNIGPAIDGWITAAFPGSAALSKASKAGLVSAVVTVLNEVDPGAVPGLTTSVPVASAPGPVLVSSAPTAPLSAAIPLSAPAAHTVASTS